MQILRWKDVIRLTGLSQSTISRQIKAGKFPKPVKIAKRAVGWPEDQLTAWTMNHFKSFSTKSEN